MSILLFWSNESTPCSRNHYSVLINETQILIWSLWVQRFWSDRISIDNFVYKIKTWLYNFTTVGYYWNLANWYKEGHFIAWFLLKKCHFFHMRWSKLNNKKKCVENQQAEGHSTFYWSSHSTVMLLFCDRCPFLF